MSFQDWCNVALVFLGLFSLLMTVLYLRALNKHNEDLQYVFAMKRLAVTGAIQEAISFSSKTLVFKIETHSHGQTVTVLNEQTRLGVCKVGILSDQRSLYLLNREGSEERYKDQELPNLLLRVREEIANA